MDIALFWATLIDKALVVVEESFIGFVFGVAVCNRLLVGAAHIGAVLGVLKNAVIQLQDIMINRHWGRKERLDIASCYISSSYLTVTFEHSQNIVGHVGSKGMIKIFFCSRI